MTTYGAPARVALKIAKRNFKKYGSEVTATLCFYEDKVIVHNHQEDSEGDLRYEQILAVRQSPRLYLLELPGKTALLLEKTAFTKGALEEFPRLYAAEMPRPGRLLRKARKKDLHPGEKCAILFPVKSVIQNSAASLLIEISPMGVVYCKCKRLRSLLFLFTGGQ